MLLTYLSLSNLSSLPESKLLIPSPDRDLIPRAASFPHGGDFSTTVKVKGDSFNMLPLCRLVLHAQWGTQSMERYDFVYLPVDFTRGRSLG